MRRQANRTQFRNTSVRGKKAKDLRKSEHSSHRKTGKRRALTFALKFLAIATPLILLLSVIPEDWFAPLNRLTAILAAYVLHLFGLHPVVTGTLIRQSGFSVNIIAECSAVRLLVIFFAFVTAFPPKKRKYWGLAIGASSLMVINILRIALVTVIGAYHPDAFKVAHVYLGQMVMVCTVLVLCLWWCRWSQSVDRLETPGHFLMRFIPFSSVPFLLWLPINLSYIRVIDKIIQHFFSKASYSIAIFQSHDIYYQNFSIIASDGLLAAFQVPVLKKLLWTGVGLLGISVFQIGFRLCNVLLSVFDIEWILFLSQGIYTICVFLFPLSFAIYFLIRFRLRPEKYDRLRAR